MARYRLTMFGHEFREARGAAQIVDCFLETTVHPSMKAYLTQVGKRNFQEKRANLSMNESVSFGNMLDMGTQGERIKHLRGEMTQAEFAELIGVSRGAVGNWEIDKGIKTENLALIAEKTGTSLDWLANEVGELPKFNGAKSRPAGAAEARSSPSDMPHSEAARARRVVLAELAIEFALAGFDLEAAPQKVRRLALAAVRSFEARQASIDLQDQEDDQTHP